MRHSVAAFAALLCSACGAADEVPSAGTAEPAGSIEIFDSAALNYLDPELAPLVVASGFAWAEGPLWIESGGYLLFSDIPNNRMHRYRPGEGTRVYLENSGATGLYEGDYGTGSNALLLDAEGRLILMQQGDRRIARMDAPLDAPRSEFTTLASHFDGMRLNSPNDAVFHSDGSLYFTDPPYGMPGILKDERKELPFQGVYRLLPDGELELLDDSVRLPNGIGLSPDEATLYIAASDKLQPVWYAYDVGPNGALSNKRQFFDSRELAGSGDDPGYPDGLAVHSSGAIFASGPGGVWLFSAGGELLARIVTGKNTTNCAFSADEDTLYISVHDAILSLPLNSPR